MGNSTIGGVTIHNGSNIVIVESMCRKNSDLVIMPMYTLNSDQTNVFDFGGTTKTLTFTGNYISDTLSDIIAWVKSMEDLQQGQQDIGSGYPLTLVDDLRKASDGTDLKVKINNFESTYSAGDKSKLSWTLSVVQSSEVA